MKFIFTFIFLFSTTCSFAQWTRVQQLPVSDIFTVYHNGNTVYAGGTHFIYISRDKGQTWDSTAITGLASIDNIIVHHSELYASGFSSGIFKSVDDGATWRNITPGIFPAISDLCEFRGDLYAATLGNSVYKLNPAGRSSWLFFSNGLSDLSANLPAIAANGEAMVAGTLANGIYDRLPANTATWEERLLTGQLEPNEGAYDIINAHDTLFYCGRKGKFYMSTNNGLGWNVVGNRLSSLFSPLANARQALLTSVYFFDGARFNTAYYYIKKDSLQNPFVNFNVATDHFTYKLDITGDKLWDASDRGLFYMSLSDLPGITSADDSGVALPMQFLSFDATCRQSKELVTWTTINERNGGHFTIERSSDNVNWIVLDLKQDVGAGGAENNYSFTDNNPVQNSFYRVVQHDADGGLQFSSVIRASCISTNSFVYGPNPVVDKMLIVINSDRTTSLMLRIFDSKGALVKTQSAAVAQGNNQVTVDMKVLAAGVYYVSANWDDGEMQKGIRVVKL
jgi:hypothetical protein